MTNSVLIATTQAHDAASRKKGLAFWLRQLAPIAFAFGASTAVTFALLHFKDSMAGIGIWGYPSVFLAELASSASVIIPTPGHAYSLAMSVSLNPFFLGLAGGLGAALGELTGYFVGANGRKALGQGRVYRWFQALSRRGVGLGLFVLAAVPSPFDVAGLWAGSVGYSLPRFLLFVTLGKVLKVTAIALGGYYGLQWLF